MKPRSAKKTFLQRIQQAGHNLASLHPTQGIEAMLDFYATERADGCSLDEDGDMLVYQWGTYDWGSGESFEFNISRQFITGPDGDDDIRQLSLTFKFQPTTPLRGVANGNRWCHSPAELTAFRSFILGSPPYAVVGQLQPESVSLKFGGV